MSETETPEKTQSEEEAPQKDQFSEYFLVAEDSKPIRRILAVLLESHGYGAIEASDGEEAAKLISETKDKPIIGVFTDIMMPKKSGLDLLKEIRESGDHKNTPVIMITANPQKDFVIEAKSLNVQGFLIKPITTDKVLKQLKVVFPDRTFKRVMGT